MPELLELAELLEEDDVSEVEVRGCGVKASLHPERSALLELLEEFLLLYDLRRSLLQEFQLFFGTHGRKIITHSRGAQ